MSAPTIPICPRINRRDFLRRTLVAGTAIGLGRAIPGWTVENGVLHIRNYVDIKSLDPAFSVSGGEGIVSDALFRSLLIFKSDSGWDTELDAAEYFERIDDTHYAFRLKAGIRFTDGFGEMTADDVKFSLERIVDPAVKALNAPDLATLSRVDVHDRYSGTIVLSTPYAALTTVGLASGTGAILSRKAVESVGGRFSVRPPCCSGPYRFVSWQSQRKTVLERNPDFNGPPAPFDQIHVYAMNDDKAAEMAFEAGQLDCATISIESTGPFAENPPPDSHVDIYPSGRSYWLGINQAHPKLQDRRVRQAIQYGVDAEAVVEAAWFGLAETGTGPIPKGMIGHRPQALVPPGGDPERARGLLREAGVELPLRLRLDVETNTVVVTAVQVIQWSLKKIGIEVEIFPQDNSTFLTLGREDAGEQWRDVQLFFQNFIGSADPYYSLVWFTSQQLGIWNWERFSNPQFDELNDRALASGDEEARDAMYRRMQDLMEESGCYRFVTNGIMPQAVRNSVIPAFQPDGYAMLRHFRPRVTSA
jgi:peptide/nickel transport system substrate-binding protein